MIRPRHLVSSRSLQLTAGVAAVLVGGQVLGYDTRQVRVEVGYINQYVRRFHDPDQLNHVFALNFIIKLGHGKHAPAPAAAPAAAPVPNH